MAAEARVWIGYGGEQACFWRAVGNTFPCSAVRRNWRLGDGNIYIGDTRVGNNASLSDLELLGHGKGTFQDPLIIREELATDSSDRFFYCEAAVSGQAAAFNLTGSAQVQLWQLARHFGIWPWTAWIFGVGREGKLQIDEVQRFSGKTGSSKEPFEIRGYYGPFSRGSLGSVCETLGSSTSSQGVLDLSIVEPLHMSFSVAVYSTVIIGTGEQAVLKLDYDPNRSLNTKIGVECGALSDLRDKGIMSPSLPVLVRQGFYHPSGSLRCEFGDVSALVTKPLGKRCVEGMVLRGEKLCKLAFDILLALYHLHLVGRKHRDVRVQNMVLASDDQYMLIDLEYAYTVDMEHLYSAGPMEAAASDCRDLLVCLLELSGNRLATRQVASDEEDVAIQVLERESTILGELAKYVFGLPGEVLPDFKTWLNALAGPRGCSLPPEYVKVAVAGQVSSDRFMLITQTHQGYPSDAVWITYEGQTRCFSPAEHGKFPLGKIKHFWNFSEVSVAGVVVTDEDHLRVLELCSGLGHGNGSRVDPLRVTGRHGAARLVRCEDDVPEVCELLNRLHPLEREDLSSYTGCSQALSCAGRRPSFAQERGMFDPRQQLSCTINT